MLVNSKATVIKKEKVIITKICPTPFCPPGFTLKTGEKKTQLEASPMLQTSKTTPSSAVSKLNILNKTSGFEQIDNNYSTLVFPTEEEIDTEKWEDCVEFDCLPERPKPSDTPSQTISVVCPEPNCPAGYKVVISATVDPSQKCAQYKCELLPQSDAVCNITGRTFNTFDGTEFKYDICNHLLARDIVSQKWTIASKCYQLMKSVGSVRATCIFRNRNWKGPR